MASERITGHLQLVKSDCLQTPKRVDLKGDEVTLGRGLANTVVWGSQQVSRKHAIMVYKDQTWKLKDLSTNGLLINGTKVKRNEFVDLHDSDLISFIPTGAIQYRFFTSNYPPTIVLDSPQSSSYIQTQPITQSRSPMRSVTTTTSSNISGISPKRKTTSAFNPLDKDRKRKRLINAPPVTTIIEDNSDSVVEIEPALEFYSAVEDNSPTSSSSTGSQSIFKPSSDNALDISELEGNDDINVVKEKLKASHERIRELELQNNKLKFEKNKEMGALKNKILTAQSECRVFKEDLFNQLMEVMENEFSCCICNEIFIQATVIDCGHTFCAHCISEWVKRKPECPNCRKHVRVQVKHVEMENFVIKLHTLFSEEIMKRRAQIIEDRNREVRQAKEAAAATARGSNSARGGGAAGRGSRAVEFSFPPERLVDFLAELQQINDMFQPAHRTAHHHPGQHFPPPNLGAAAPDVPPFNLPNFHSEQLLASRAAHMFANDRSRRRSSRISVRGGRPPLPVVTGGVGPGGIGRGNPPNIPLDAHLPEFAIGPMDILTVD